MICPICQFDNPEQNRFCGGCGTRLGASAAPVDQHRPGSEPGNVRANGSAVRRPFIVSTTAMADVTAQMLNTHVVLPTPTIGSSTHTSYVPVTAPKIHHGEDLAESEPAPVDPNDEPYFSDGSALGAGPDEGSVHEIDFDAPEERPSEEWLEHSAAEHESHLPPASVEPQGTTSILGLSGPAADITAEMSGTPVDSTADLNDAKFLHFDDEKETTASDVSGPSFLGLGSTADQDYLLEDQPPVSHARRNVLLVLVAIVAVLGVLEWRASRNGESMNPADVLHLKIPKKKGPGEVVVVPPSANAPAANTSNATTESSDGKPDLVAEPNQPATAASAPSAVESSGASNPSNQTSNPSNQTSAAVPATTSAQTPPPSAAVPAKAAAPGNTEIAKATPPPTSAKPPAAVPQSDTTLSSAKPEASKPAASTAEPADASLSAGSFELQKGIAAGPTDLGRMWLWKATAKGNGEAPVLLAEMFAQGKGVPRDCDQAMVLLNAAARKANPHARTVLANMYAAGQCVPQDRVAAYKWMHEALLANPGSDWIAKDQQNLWNQMTPAERQRAAAFR